MATSPNYGWLEPDNTDLVKNGALSIRTLGNAIDTTMATMTPKSTYTAKGSIAAATAASTPANLAVGNNGETLVADSSTSTGLRYNPSQAAGKNAVINGDFDIWQRGTSSTTNGAYNSADRWWNYTGAGTNTWARESTIVPSGSLYSMKSTQSVASSSNWQMNQVIETLNAVQFAGKTITLSAQFCASASTTVFIAVSYSTSTDVAPTGSWTGITATSGTTGATSATTASFTQLQGQFAIPSTAKSILVVVGSTSVASGTSIYVGKVQFELGSVQTTFTKAGGTIQGELSAAQRYYTRESVTTTYAYFRSSGNATNTTQARIIVPLPVQMRTKPSAMDIGGSLAVSDGVNLYTTGSFVLSANCTTQNAQVEYTHGSGVFTQYRYESLQDNNNGSTYLGFSAEL
jgi:hypothetical protein